MFGRFRAQSLLFLFCRNSESPDFHHRCCERVSFSYLFTNNGVSSEERSYSPVKLVINPGFLAVVNDGFTVVSNRCILCTGYVRTKSDERQFF